METHSTTQTNISKLIERLFAAGAHFGFTKSRRHPTVAPYIFANKQGTDIIDLEKTGELIEAAKTVIFEAGKAGKTVLFVGTKEEIAHTVKQYAEKIDMPYVVNRWIGGMLTNFSEIRKRLARLADLTTAGESGELERKYTKKERVIISREIEKLNFNFGGIRGIDRAPQILVIIDPRHDAIALREARDINATVIALSNSDTDLRYITHPIVANDSLQSSVAVILSELTDAYTAGKAEYVAPRRDEGRRDR
jgi:small subunit ribosomal protein S2